MNAHPTRTAEALLQRAKAAGVALGVAALAVTGIFVAKISSSYAAAHSGGTGGTVQTVNPNGSIQQNQGSSNGGGQLSAPQQNQAPVGRSNGS